MTRKLKLEIFWVVYYQIHFTVPQIHIFTLFSGRTIIAKATAILKVLKGSHFYVFSLHLKYGEPCMFSLFAAVTTRPVHWAGPQRGWSWRSSGFTVWVKGPWDGLQMMRDWKTKGTAWWVLAWYPWPVWAVLRGLYPCMSNNILSLWMFRVGVRTWW